MIWDADLENVFLREPVKYDKNVQRVIGTDSFGSSGDKKNSFVLVSGGGEVCGGLWVARVQLLFQVAVKKVMKVRNMCFCSIWL